MDGLSAIETRKLVIQALEHLFEAIPEKDQHKVWGDFAMVREYIMAVDIN